MNRLEKRKSFMMYASFIEPIRLLTQAQKGDLLDAVFTYQATGCEPKMDPQVHMCFMFMKIQFDADSEKYRQKCEKNRASINARWHASSVSVGMGTNTSLTDDKCDNDDKKRKFSGENFKEKPPLRLEDSGLDLSKVPDSFYHIASETGYTGNVESAYHSFVVYWKSKTGSAGRHSDWMSVWRTWLWRRLQFTANNPIKQMTQHDIDFFVTNAGGDSV